MKDPSDWKNWAALGADVGCAIILGATGGGALVKAANKATDVMKVADKTKDVAVVTAKTIEKIAVNSAAEGAIYGGTNAVNQYVTTGQVDLKQVASATSEGAIRRAIGEGAGLAGIKILSKTNLGKKVLNKVADVYNKIDNKLINVYENSAARINNTISNLNPFNRVQMAGVGNINIPMSYADDMMDVENRILRMDTPSDVNGLGVSATGVSKVETGNPVIDNIQKRLPNDEIIPPSIRGEKPISIKDDKPVEIHHVDQDPNKFQEMHPSDHRYGENYKNNHPNYNQPSKIDRIQFRKDNRGYWENEWDSGRWDDPNK